jgi:hypothetical protein
MRLVVFATMIMSACVLGVMLILPTDPLKLLVGIPIGIIIFLTAAFLFKIEELNEVFKVILSILGKQDIDS